MTISHDDFFDARVRNPDGPRRVGCSPSRVRKQTLVFEDLEATKGFEIDGVFDINSATVDINARFAAVVG